MKKQASLDGRLGAEFAGLLGKGQAAPVPTLAPPEPPPAPPPPPPPEPEAKLPPEPEPPAPRAERARAVPKSPPAAERAEPRILGRGAETKARPPARVSVGLRLEPALHGRLKRAAHRTDEPLQALIEEALGLYLDMLEAKLEKQR